LKDVDDKSEEEEEEEEEAEEEKEEESEEEQEEESEPEPEEVCINRYPCCNLSFFVFFFSPLPFGSDPN
jgi:hypothetical protein